MAIIAALLSAIKDAQARDLTFEDRVKAQEAIERVYYSHQIGAKKPFEEAVPRSVLEQKVRIHLKESVALEKFWHTPITADMLQKEVERMARRTRMPERLRALYAALGNDSLLIQECIARPALVNRLAHNFFSSDERIHRQARLEAEGLRGQLVKGRTDPWADHKSRIEVRFRRSVGGDASRRSGATNIPEEDFPSNQTTESLPPQEFDRWSGKVPGQVGDVGPVEEDREAFAVRVTLDRSRDELRVANYSVPKIPWDDWWVEVEQSIPDPAERVASSAVPLTDPTGRAFGLWQGGASSLTMSEVAQESPALTCIDDSWDNGILDDLPDPRAGHTAVWTGGLMLVWGGSNAGAFSSTTGGRYDPATDSWAPISTLNAPSARRNHTAVWTGSLMIIWDGTFDSTGGRYDPTTDSWSPTSTTVAPAGRYGHSAVWTGKVMIVWGGQGLTGPLDTGGRYDPVADSWTPTSTENAPTPRTGYTAVWTAGLMVVWGGGDSASVQNTGGRYDPVADSWMSTSTSDAPSARFGHTAVWTGTSMVVWGGANQLGVGSTGGRYDPIGDTWTPSSVTDAPVGRYLHSAVWTGSSVVVWGGIGGSGNLKTGGRYDPSSDTWSATSVTNAPSPRNAHTAVWTGSLMIVWGGSGPPTYVNTGGRYDPLTDTWTPTADTGAPANRHSHSVVWTGNLMVVWGGTNQIDYYDTGGRYNPVLDTWTPTSTTKSPEARIGHAAVWTGEVMVVWGGANRLGVLGAGGQYDPMLDIWVGTSTANAPEARSSPSAVWTGSLMLVWGGRTDRYSFLNTGGRYDPDADLWTPTSVKSAPSGRYFHSAVWTGISMVVWGGTNLSEGFNTGGRYDPSTDTWTPTTTLNAPAGRTDHATVWTGSRMIVWGGIGASGNLATGGQYDPIRDSWAPTSTSGVPDGRALTTAVWTGSVMVLWGGDNFSGPLSTGARYDPASDGWAPTSMINAPSARVAHTAVWTGGAMIVWGGFTGAALNSGGRYCACTPNTYFLDSDGDGYGDRGISVESCTQPSDYVTNSDDCDDTNPAVQPGAAEVCNGIDNDCNGQVDEGFDVGTACTAMIDSCHQVSGSKVCTVDGLGTVCEGVVSLYDTTPPAIACPAGVSLECPASVASIGMAKATDICDSAPRVETRASGTLPLGTTAITWTATDASGNTSACQQSVTVRDSTPPQLGLTLNPTLLWPPNHRMAPVQATWQVSDICDPAPGVVLASATSTEPDDAPGSGDGSTTGDIQDASIGTPDPSVLLRAERSGNGPGRIYTLTYTARDASGNTSSALGLVMVPHDEGIGVEPVQMSVEGDGTPGMAHLYWNAVPGAEMYDVIRGDLSQVSESNREIWLGRVHVLASGQTGTSFSEGSAGAIPPVGEAFFYLVQFRDGLSASGWGTESSPWPAEPKSCDVDCPGEVIGTSIASGDPLRT